MFADFMINTWIAASLVAVASGVVGLFVVLRGASFAAHALPLGAFPGAAAAGLLGLNAFVGALVFALLGVVGIRRLGRGERHEVATALSLVVLLGCGAFFLSRSTEYAQATSALLFGQILGVDRDGVLMVGATSLLSVSLVLALFRPLLLGAVSPELARLRGVPAAIDTVFLAVIALAGAAALPEVGALLVFSLVVGPASAARSLASRPMLAMLLSVAIALAIVWAAIALAFLTNWPVGFFVGASGLVCYAAGYVARRGRVQPGSAQPGRAQAAQVPPSSTVAVSG